MTHTMSKQRKLTSRRAVAPVIATLLLVAIAVVGGSIVFVFSQGFFSSAQISGTPQIESLEIVGYDARDTEFLEYHNGEETFNVADGAIDDQLAAGERLGIYVQNQGISTVTLTEVRLAGTVYTYNNTAGATELSTVFGAGSLTDIGGFVIATGVDDTSGNAELNPAGNAEIEPGQTVTIVVGLEDNLKEGRDAQIKLSTANSAVFAGTVVAGQQSG